MKTAKQHNKYVHLFGPVPSRRLGISLGVDLIPYKTCSFDCVYCESGKTTDLTVTRQEFYSVDEIISELEDYLSTEPVLDYITFSGAGEPLLYSKISEIAAFIKKKFGKYKTALITNGSFFMFPAIHKELYQLDLIVPSLDAVSNDVFTVINKPHRDVKIADIVDGLIAFSQNYSGKIWLEVFIIEGVNDTDDELKNIRSVIDQVKPEKVQINSLDRPGTDEKCKKASYQTLLKARQIFGPTAEIVSRTPARKHMTKLSEDLETVILSTIKIRPMTFDDLLTATGADKEALDELIILLVKEQKIVEQLVNGNLFYKINVT